MKKNKEQKKARKEEKKVRVTVAEAFTGDKKNAKKNELVDMLTKTVLVNKAVLKRDKKLFEVWQHSYYQELFSKFRELVEEHNKIYQFKADDLLNKINIKETRLKTVKQELNQTKEELRRIKLEKGILEHA